MASKKQRGLDVESGRSLVVAYLSYALPDVAALSPIALELLRMTISSLCEGYEVNGVELRDPLPLRH